MLVTPLNITFDDKCNTNITFLDGTESDNFHNNDGDFQTYNYDFFTLFPTIYYRSTEITPDRFLMKFSIYPFPGCHEIFGENVLIGTGSGYVDAINGKIYANVFSSQVQVTFSQVRDYITNRGKGYYGMSSDEMGVLMFLNIYKNGVNKNILDVNTFLGIHCILVNGNNGRMYPPNIEIDNAVAKVTHLDGNVEYLKVPYIWGGGFGKLWIGEYLTILPKEGGSGIYESRDCWMGNGDGVGIYCPANRNWRICADRNDIQSSQVKEVCLKIRPCFKGRIVETLDVDYFKSVSIIN